MAAPAATSANAPKETVYVNNLSEKVNQEEMKKSLYAVFAPFGPIIDIVHFKSNKMRGQAFVVFRDVPAASSAVRQMQGFPFYDKPMKLDYAKAKSDATAKLDGSYLAKVREERTAKRRAEREERKAGAKKEKAAAPKAPREEAADAEMAAPAAPAAPAANLPNPILFVEDLPDQVNEMMLSMLFSQFPGFKEVRLVPGKAGIAFVEFESEMQSGVAMGGLQGFKITPTNLMKITYARR